MEPKLEITCIAFAGTQKIAAGTVPSIIPTVKKYLDAHPDETLLIFDDQSSEQVEIDLRGSIADALARVKTNDENTEEKAGPGRPRLGVVSREIGLLPRHWEWLALQPGGASVTLRKLVEEARKKNSQQDDIKRSQNVAYKFMSAMAGNLPHFEEASRAFFAKNKALFLTLIAGWPKDVRDHTLILGETAFARDVS